MGKAQTTLVLSQQLANKIKQTLTN